MIMHEANNMHFLPLRFFHKYIKTTITNPPRMAAIVKPAVVIALDGCFGGGWLGNVGSGVGTSK
jgi:hypothetical protein